MKTSTIIYFVLCAICLIGALIIFFNGLGVKALWFLLFGIGAALFFREGMAETRKKDNEPKQQ